MERLVIAILKLVLQLAWWLFKLALRLVLYAWTKDWHKLDKLEAQVREALEQARKGATPQASAGATPRSAPRPRSAAAGQAPWQFEFAPELTEAEPAGELQGGESAARGGEYVIQPTKRAPRRKPPPQPKELPLALALRDSRTMRDAMVLTAVLGPRPRRARRH